MTTENFAAIIELAKTGATGKLGPGLFAYYTAGGTYMLASDPVWNDNGKPHDLLAIMTMPAENNSRVLVLRFTVNPDLVAALRAEFDLHG